jgi:hypothetical protein
MTKGILAQKIKKFECLYNGIQEAFIDVSNIKKIHDRISCKIILYESDFSSETLFMNVEYPINLLQKI